MFVRTVLAHMNTGRRISRQHGAELAVEQVGITRSTPWSLKK